MLVCFLIVALILPKFDQVLLYHEKKWCNCCCRVIYSAICLSDFEFFFRFLCIFQFLGGVIVFFFSILQCLSRFSEIFPIFRFYSDFSILFPKYFQVIYPSFSTNCFSDNRAVWRCTNDFSHSRPAPGHLHADVWPYPSPRNCRLHSRRLVYCSDCGQRCHIPSLNRHYMTPTIKNIFSTYIFLQLLNYFY